MNIATEIRLPRVRVRQAQKPCVRVYTREGEKPKAQPQPVAVDTPKPFDEWTEDALALAWQKMTRKEGHMPGFDYQAPQPGQISTKGGAKALIYAHRRVLQAAQKPITTDQIAALLGRATTSVYSTCLRLLDRCLLEKTVTAPGVPTIWTTTGAGITALRTGTVPAVDVAARDNRLRYQPMRQQRLAQILHQIAIRTMRDTEIRDLIGVGRGGYWDSLAADLIHGGYADRTHVNGNQALEITDAGREAHARHHFGAAVFGQEAEAEA
jgi:hypothetical protein